MNVPWYFFNTYANAKKDIQEYSYYEGRIKEIIKLGLEKWEDYILKLVVLKLISSNIIHNL